MRFCGIGAPFRLLSQYWLRKVKSLKPGTSEYEDLRHVIVTLTIRTLHFVLQRDLGIYKNISKWMLKQ
jgi:hypothetical protein